MNTGDWWCDTYNQVAAGGTVVPVICASDITDLTNSLGDYHGWQRDFTIGNIRKDIGRTPKKCAWCLIGLISCRLKSCKNRDDAGHSEVGIVLSPLPNLDITRAGFTWNRADGIH